MNVVIVGPFWFPRERGLRPDAEPRPGSARRRRPRARDLHGAAARRARRGPSCRVRRIRGGVPRVRGPDHRRRPRAGATPSGRSPGCGRAWPTRSGGSAASTPPPPPPTADSLSSWSRRQCDLVFVYDRSALRMTPLARLCRAWGVTSVLDVTELERAPRVAAEPPLLGLRPRHARHPSPLRRPHRHHHRPRGPLPRPGLSPDSRRARDRGLAADPGPAPHREPRVPAGLRGHTAAARRSGAPLRGLSAAQPRAGAGDPGRDRPLRGNATGPEVRRALRAGRGAVAAASASWAPSATPPSASAWPAPTACSSPAGPPAPRSCRSPPASWSTCAADARSSSRTWATSPSTCVTGSTPSCWIPGSPRRVAGAIAAVAGGADRGAEIGRRGREAGARAFDRRSHAVRLLRFVAGLRDPGVAA